MAVKIRLKRVGKKNQPSYRIVVADERESRDGSTIAELGHYNPLTEPGAVTLDVEAALAWLRKGAQPSPAARRVLAQTGVMRLYHEARHGQPDTPPAP